MNIGIEDYLQKIDVSLQEKSQKDIYMLYIMIFGMIFAFSYLLFWDSSEADFKAKQAKVTAIKSKIALDKNYLQGNTLQKIKNIDNEIIQIQKDIITFKDNNQYIKHKIEEISFLIYDEQKWGKYLFSISKNAKKYNIKILNFSNKLAEKEDVFGHVLDINIHLTAQYNDTLNFINSLEQSDLVIDMHDINITATDRLDSNLSISVWGITY